MSAPMLPPAPVRFSTRTGWPHVSCMRAAIVRVSVSSAPPAANGAMKRIGFDGKAWASAPPESTSAAAKAMACRKVMVLPLVASAHDATLRYICPLAMRLAFLLAAACCAGAAFAQSIPSRLPGLAPASKAQSPAAAQPPAPIDALDASLEKRIADARAELERIGRQVATREGVPAGVPNDALIERRATAERLVRSLEQTLDNERILVETQRRRAEL